MESFNTPENQFTIEWIVQNSTRLRLGFFNNEGATPTRAHAAVLHGRSEFIEKYAETAGDLAARGIGGAVVEWRSHGLSGGREGDNPQRHHLDDFSLLADDMEAVIARIDAQATDAAPKILLAHSMGGLGATLHLARNPHRYAAAILCSPMFAVNTAPLPRRAARWIAEAACALGFSRRYAFGQHDYDPAEAVFTSDNRLTSDPARYAVLHDAWKADPRLRLGGVTFGWLAAAFRAAKALTDDGVPLDRIETPVLILSAQKDRVVDARAHAVVARRFRNARVVEFPDAEHELLMERDEIRNEVWRAIDAFLAETLPKKAAPL
jgi:lysophospholipase